LGGDELLVEDASANAHAAGRDYGNTRARSGTRSAGADNRDASAGSGASSGPRNDATGFRRLRRYHGSGDAARFGRFRRHDGSGNASGGRRHDNATGCRRHDDAEAVGPGHIIALRPVFRAERTFENRASRLLRIAAIDLPASSGFTTRLLTRLQVFRRL
jgi:hypothetical protein